MDKLETVYLETSSHCNLACAYCYRTLNDYPSKGRLMEFSLFAKAVEGIARGGDRPALFLHGFGEPMLHPRLEDMTALAASSRAFCSVSFVSNLCAAPAARYEACFSKGLDRLFFSLDALQPELMASTRRGMDIPKALGTLKSLAPTYPDRLTPITVLSRHNLDLLPGLGALFRDLGIRNWNVQLHHDHKGGFGVDAAEAARTKAEVAALFPEMRLAFEEPGLFACRQPYNTLVVNAAGHVTPCCSLTNHAVADFGDLSVQDVLACRESGAFDAFRAEFALGRPKACGICPYYGSGRE